MRQRCLKLLIRYSVSESFRLFCNHLHSAFINMLHHGPSFFIVERATTCGMCNVQVCSNSFDIACFVIHGCWGKIGKFTGLLSGLVAGVLLVGLAAKLGLLSSCAAHMHAACCAGRAMSALGGGQSTASKPPPPSSCCGGSSTREDEERAVVAGGSLAAAAALVIAAQKARGYGRGRRRREFDDSDEEWERGGGRRGVIRDVNGRMAGRRERQYSAQNSAYEDDGYASHADGYASHADGYASRGRYASHDGYASHGGTSAEAGRGEGQKRDVQVGSKDSDKLILAAIKGQLNGVGSGGGGRGQEPRSRGVQSGRLSGLMRLIRAEGNSSPRGPAELSGGGGGEGGYSAGRRFEEDVHGSPRPGKRRAMTAPEPAAQMSSRQEGTYAYDAKPRMMSAPAAAATAAANNTSPSWRQQLPSHDLSGPGNPRGLSLPPSPRGRAGSLPVSPTRFGGGQPLVSAEMWEDRRTGRVQSVPTHSRDGVIHYGNPLYEQSRG